MAAADFYWRGNGAGTKSAWADGRNWVNAAGAPYPQARYPGSSAGDHDGVYFDAALSTGAASMAGYDASALVYLSKFAVGPLYDGTVGDATTPVTLPVGVTTVRIVSTRSPGVYLSTNGSGAVLYMHDAALLSLKGRWSTAYLFRGLCSVAAEAGGALNNLYIGYTSNVLGDVRLSIAAGVSMPAPGAYFQVMGGTTACAASVSAMSINAGQWTQTGDISALWMHGACKYIWADGSLDTAEVFAGLFDASGYSTPRVYVAIDVYPAGTVNLNNGLGNVTGSTLTNYGGTIYTTPGT